jgi:hypothetical protein
MDKKELIRFVDRRRGRTNTRAGYLVRTMRGGKLVLDVPEIGRQLTILPEQVLARKGLTDNTN